MITCIRVREKVSTCLSECMRVCCMSACNACVSNVDPHLLTRDSRQALWSELQLLEGAIGEAGVAVATFNFTSHRIMHWP